MPTSKNKKTNNSLNREQEGFQILDSKTFENGLVKVDIVKDLETDLERYVVNEPKMSKKEKRDLEFLKESLVLYYMSNMDFLKQMDPQNKAMGEADQVGLDDNDVTGSKKRSKDRRRHKLRTRGIFSDSPLFIKKKSHKKREKYTRKKSYMAKGIRNIINRYSMDVDAEELKKLKYYINRDFIGYGKIDPIMKDGDIEDISCDGPGRHVFVDHRKHQSLRTNILFNDDDVLDSYVISLAQRSNRSITIAEPILDATMPDGSRLHATLSNEVTIGGSSFTIRRFKEKPMTPIDLVRNKTITPIMAAFLWIATQYGFSMMFAGGTASGKTTMLNATSLFIDPNKKIVSIEDTHELNLPHENWIAGVTRESLQGSSGGGKVRGDIDMFDLAKAALRQRPKYIIMGEVRGRETYVLFQAMATGHTTMSTIHAHSQKTLVQRLESPPINIPRSLLQALDFVIILTPTMIGDKYVRRVKSVVEIRKFQSETNDLITGQVFNWNPEDDTFSFLGDSILFDKIMELTNLDRKALIRELKRRERIIKCMESNNIREYDEFVSIISQYYKNPKKVMKMFSKDGPFVCRGTKKRKRITIQKASKEEKVESKALVPMGSEDLIPMESKEWGSQLAKPSKPPKPLELDDILEVPAHVLDDDEEDGVEVWSMDYNGDDAEEEKEDYEDDQEWDGEEEEVKELQELKEKCSIEGGEKTIGDGIEECFKDQLEKANMETSESSNLEKEEPRSDDSNKSLKIRCQCRNIINIKSKNRPFEFRCSQCGAGGRLTEEGVEALNNDEEYAEDHGTLSEE